MIKACIFDCDGTLLDTLVSIAYCANKTLKDFDLPQIPQKEYRYMVGDGAKTLIQRCLAYDGDTKGERLAEVLARYKEYFAVDCMYQVKPYNGIVELLAFLKEKGIKTAVLSNKPHAQTETVIADMFAEGTFDEVLGQKEGIPIKPAPDGAKKLAEAFGTEPSECLYLGDTNTDMKTGNGAGMHTVGVLWGFRDREELESNHAEYIISHPREVLPIIKALSSENEASGNPKL